MRSIRLVTITLSLSLCCSVQLVNPPGPTQHPLEGLWYERETFADLSSPGRLYLEIRRGTTDKYDFRLFRSSHRDLIKSGKTLIYTEISGRVMTSRSEAMLRRDVFISASIANRSGEPGRVWPVNEYQPELLDRRVEGGGDIALLQLSADGTTLEGSGWIFARSAPPILMGKQVRSLGMVLRVTEDGRRAQVSHYAPELKVSGLVCDVIRSGAVVGRARIIQGMEREALAEADGIMLSPGDTIGFLGPSKVDTGKLPTRAEVLEKLKRGENVPRDIIIKVLGNQ